MFCNSGGGRTDLGVVIVFDTIDNRLITQYIAIGEQQRKAQIEAHVKAQVEAQVKAQVEAQVKGQVEAQVKGHGESLVKCQVLDTVMDRITGHVKDKKAIYDSFVLFRI